MEFVSLTQEHISLLKRHFFGRENHSADRTVGGVMLWRDYFKPKLAVFGDSFILKVQTEKYGTAFTFPDGDNVGESLAALVLHCRKAGIPLVLTCVTDSDAQKLSGLPSAEVIPERDLADYIYDYSSLTELKGKALATPRNHINKFTRLYPDFTFELMTVDTAAECLSFFTTSLPRKEGVPEAVDAAAVEDALLHFSEYGFIGGILSVKGQIVGFTCAEVSGDTLVVHIEKADTSFEGAYPMLTNQFLKAIQNDSLLFINREEDLGDEGLRHSKLSYRPCELLMKNTVIIK